MGQGGFGTVYKATARFDPSQVFAARKKIKVFAVKESYEMKELEKEAKVLSRLHKSGHGDGRGLLKFVGAFKDENSDQMAAPAMRKGRIVTELVNPVQIELKETAPAALQFEVPPEKLQTKTADLRAFGTVMHRILKKGMPAEASVLDVSPACFFGRYY